jgi:hypothetical protein
LKKRVFLIFVLSIFLGIGLFAQNNWISVEPSVAGIGARYERVINPYFTVGANVYINYMPMPMAHENVVLFGASASARWYPTGRKFFLELDFGTTTYDGDRREEYEVMNNGSRERKEETIFYSFSGFTITPGLGWTIDVGKVGAFFISPGIKLPFIFVGENSANNDRIRTLNTNNTNNTNNTTNNNNSNNLIDRIDDFDDSTLFSPVLYFAIGYAF